MGKALGKIDFLRFFNEKFNNFRTKLDMNLIFLKKLCKNSGQLFKFEKKEKKESKNLEKKVETGPIDELEKQMRIQTTGFITER